MTNKKPKFKRTDFAKYSKLGVRRKNKQVYRKAKGIDNKIRLKMKGHVRNVSVGFRREKKKRNLIRELKPVMINNLEDLKKIGKQEIGIIIKMGNKKRKQILDYAIKHNIKLSINVKKALEKIEHKTKKRHEKKQTRKTKRIARDKKAQKEAEKKAKQEAKQATKENKKEKTENKESVAHQEPSEKKESSSSKEHKDIEGGK